MITHQHRVIMELNNVAEIQVSYKTKVKASDRPRITSSRDVNKILHNVWDTNTIEYNESFYILLLNRANAVLGYRLIGIGGQSGVVVDIKQLLAVALKTNAAGIILAHNHPSSNLKPSQADIDLTRKVKVACGVMELALLDHIIVSPEGAFYSLADEGMIGTGHVKNKKLLEIIGFRVLAI